jgi:hypothetical protein
MDHYLVQTWLNWWQGALAAFSFSTVMLSLEENTRGSLWRDIANLLTGAGAGWAATREGFFHLMGWELSQNQPGSGGEAVRDTLGSYLRQLWREIFGSAPAAAASGSAAGSSEGSAQHGAEDVALEDLLPPELGGKITLQDVAEAIRQSRESQGQ